MIQTYGPGFTDLYQLTWILVKENQARHWRTTASWLHPLDDIHKKDTSVVAPASQVAGDLHEAIPQAFPHATDWVSGEKFSLLHKDLIKLFMIIIHA